MKLGILYKNGEIVNHRSFIKVIFNPMLRRFGYYIGTKTKMVNGEMGLSGIKIMKCNPHKKIKWDFSNHNDYDYIRKVRRFI